MRSWLQAFRKPKPTEFEDELRFHVEHLVREKIAQGLPPDEAVRQAKLDFGNTETVKEGLRDVHRIPILDSISTHVRYAFRALRARPTYSVAVILTLTLGIGANTAVFSAVDAVLLRPLPYPNPDCLFVLHELRPKRKSPESPVAPSRLEDWNHLSKMFQAITGFYTEDTTDGTAGYYLEDGKDGDTLPVKIQRAFVAPRFLQTLGVSPRLGHDFTSEDEHFRGYAPASVIISDRFWRRHFHSDPNAIGKPMLPDKSSATVIGVMPAGFAFPDEDVELWFLVPPDAPYARTRQNTWYTAIGRLRPGATESQGRADLDLVQHQLARQFPDTDGDLSVAVSSLKDVTVGSARGSLWLLFGAVSLLLLIACSNVSALILTRSMEREREFSLRSSLGASRATILAQVFTETLLLAIGGTVAGLAIAVASARILSQLAKSIPRIGEVGLDWRLFVYTAACTMLVTLFSGLWPALQASAAPPAGALSRGGRAQISARRPAQWILVCIQVALAVSLLSGAGLLLRSFQALSEVSPGFDASHVLVFRLTGGYGETADIPKLRQSITRTLDAIRSLPGVQAAASSPVLPGVPFGYPLALVSPDAALDPTRKITAESRKVTDGYFATMQIPILAGRECDQHSDETGAVVNRSFAATYFAGLNPVGHHLVPDPNPSGYAAVTILGVAGDARETGLNHEPVPTLYGCGPVLDPDRFYLLRTANPAELATAVKQRIHSVEPARAVYDLAPLSTHLDGAFAEVRLRTLLLTLFALTALLLACVGLYGTMTYFVTTKQREIGLRIALGAGRVHVGLRFVRHSLAVSSIGVVAGLCVAASFARLLSGMLYKVRAHDATALLAAVLAMLSVAIVASAIPAIRGCLIDPIQVLRED